MAAGKCCGIADHEPRETRVNGGTLYPPPPRPHTCDPPGGFWYELWNGPIHAGQEWRCDCGLWHVMEWKDARGYSYRGWKCVGHRDDKAKT